MKVQNALLLALFPMEERLIQLYALTNYLSFLRVAVKHSELNAAYLREDIAIAERLLDKLTAAYDPAANQEENET